MVSLLAAALVLLMVLPVGCKKSTSTETKQSDVALCTGCGQIKGSDMCCKEGMPKCDSCSLAKGSPGCCKIPKGAKTAALCGHCGQIKGSELCCKAGQEKCAKCDLAKGSPGCCKLPALK